MPWNVKKDPEGCSEEKPWSVVKTDDGEIVGCHPTRESADNQVAALYAQEGGKPGEYNFQFDPSREERMSTNPAGITVNINTAQPYTWRTTTGTNVAYPPTYTLKPWDLRQEEPDPGNTPAEEDEEVTTEVAGEPVPEEVPADAEVAEEEGPDGEVEGEEHPEDPDPEPAEPDPEVEDEPEEVEGEARLHVRADARDRVVDVPPAERGVGDRAQRDLRNLPPQVLERLQEKGEDVGVVDRAFRALSEFRFRPEFRLNRDGTASVHGYATVYDFPYEVMGGPPFGWVETITRGACLRSVNNGADVRLLINHDGIPLARTRSNTLFLESDDLGLYSLAPSLDMRNPVVQSLISAMQRGDMDEMSFAFRAEQQDWNDDYTERQITEVRLYDVSIVTYPANPAATSRIRNQQTDHQPQGVGVDPDEYGLFLAQSQARGARLRAQP